MSGMIERVAQRIYEKVDQGQVNLVPWEKLPTVGFGRRHEMMDAARAAIAETREVSHHEDMRVALTFAVEGSRYSYKMWHQRLIELALGRWKPPVPPELPEELAERDAAVRQGEAPKQQEASPQEEPRSPSPQEGKASDA